MGVPVEYQYEFWSSHLQPEQITLTCLMPNGLCILLNVPSNSTFSEIKEDLWYEAQKMPLYGMLHDLSKYVFSFVNSMAELEEVTMESRRLDEVQPMCAVLKIKECEGNKTEESLNIKIGHLIGKKLAEFDALSSPEVNNFRFNMRTFVDKISKKRQKLGWREQLKYQWPPRLCSNEYHNARDLSTVNNQVYQKGKLIILVQTEDTKERRCKVSTDCHIKPHELVKIILKKNELYKNLRHDQTDDYVLKVGGCDEYLMGDYPLIRFEYISECISRDSNPILIAISRLNLQASFVNDYRYITLSKHKNQTSTLRKKGQMRSSWSIENKFQITICKINNFNFDTKRTPVEIGLLVGLFHGGKSLCELQKCKEHILSDEESENEMVVFDETITFDLQVCNIPRSVKLCFAIYEVTKSGKGVKSRRITKDSTKDIYSNPIAWANTTIFDFKNQLKTGAMTLYMWTYAEDIMCINEDLLHPLGTVVSNPNIKYATSLTLAFNASDENHTILYPSVEEMLNYIESKKENLIDENNENHEQDKEELQKHFTMESICDVHDQDRQKLWMYRLHWSEKSPGVLPKLLQCIDWDNRNDVCEAAYVLKRWELLPIEKALELLDYAYADEQVRAYAVNCLKMISDDDLLLYLLQLVQGLKHELFLDCDLVKYLLERALRNQKIGHYLFWHLKSEMQVPSVSVRFGLILEAYCRGSQEHMVVLAKQAETLEKLKQCSENIRKHRDREKAKSELLCKLRDYYCEDTMRGLTSPLDPSYRVKQLRLDKVKIMDSKMRPLWIVFENADTNGDDIYMIFKNGDDLRQDMLTLQMLRIMDKLWKQEGLDLRLNSYKCISMEYRVGLIEVVLNADTIANIQKEKGMFSATSAFKKGSLLAWLRDHNPTEAALKNACQEFTLSCAGYCVATYVLGVADRHSDNIMIKRNGQLFHIDFGHILGHFKEKFGFKRERVPFVLTHDFVHVISKGEKKNLEFKTFQHYCEKAFLILRKHGEFILSLFAMMISTGLPELSSERDLNYLKETLVLYKTEQEALKHFQSKFDEALSNSWKTSINWATHNISKNNKVN